MYICSNPKCKELFDEPKVINYVDTDAGSAQYREFEEYVCPYCGCDEIDEVVECLICGDEFSELDPRISCRSSIDYGNKTVCTSCMDKLIKKAKKLLIDGLETGEYKAFSDYFDLDSEVI